MSDESGESGFPEPDAPAWHLQQPDGTFGDPVSLLDLLHRADAGDLAADTPISLDCETLFVAAQVPQLGFDWIATAPDGSQTGPYKRAAVATLIDRGLLPEQLTLTHSETGETFAIGSLPDEDRGEADHRWQDRFMEEQRLRLEEAAEHAREQDRQDTRISALEQALATRSEEEDQTRLEREKLQQGYQQLQQEHDLLVTHSTDQLRKTADEAAHLRQQLQERELQFESRVEQMRRQEEEFSHQAELIKEESRLAVQMREEADIRLQEEKRKHQGVQAGLQQQLMEITSRVELVQRENDSFGIAARRRDEELASITTEYLKLRETLAGTEEQLSREARGARQLEIDHRKLQIQLDQSQLDLDERRRTGTEDAQTQLAREKQLGEENRDLRVENQQLIARLENMDRKQRAIDSSMENPENPQQARIRVLEQELDKMASRMDLVNRESSEIQAKNDVLTEEMHKEQAAAAQQIHALSGQVKAYEASFEELKSAHDDLAGEAIREHESAADDLRKDLESAAKDYQMLEKDKRASEKRLKTHIRKLSSQLEESRKLLSAEDTDEVVAGFAAAQKRIAELETRLESGPQSPGRTKQLEAEIQRLRQQLQTRHPPTKPRFFLLLILLAVIAGVAFYFGMRSERARIPNHSDSYSSEARRFDESIQDLDPNDLDVAPDWMMLHNDGIRPSLEGDHARLLFSQNVFSDGLNMTATGRHNLEYFAKLAMLFADRYLFTIAGHADDANEIEDFASNQALGLSRALLVVDHLRIAHGFPRSSLNAIAAPPSDLPLPDAEPGTDPRNRTVTIHVIPIGDQ